MAGSKAAEPFNKITGTLFTQRLYTVELIEPMLGTAPKDPAVYGTYVESKKNGKNGDVGSKLPEEAVSDKATIEVSTEDEAETVDKIEERGWTGFRHDENGLFLYDYMIRGHLKQAANVLKEQLDVKNLRSKLDDYLFVEPRRIYLAKYEPDGVVERPLRAMTRQGPRVTLARSDMVDAGTIFQYTLTLLKHKEITFDLIDTLLAYGRFCGYGQFRNGSYGRFMVVEATNIS